MRVSTQRTARPSFRAAQATAMVSRSVAILAPNPPPTSGAMTRIASSARPSVPASSPRASCAFCVLAHTVSRPSAHRAAAARTSSGTGATRWFVIVRSITTSQLPNAPSAGSSPPAPATLESVPSNSSVSPRSASAMLTTAGSGS